MKKLLNKTLVVLFGLLGLTGFFSILIVRHVEPMVSPAIEHYASNPISIMVFFFLRTITTIFFHFRLGIITVLFHRVLGFYKSFFISVLALNIGGHIAYFLVFRFRNQIEDFLESLPGSSGYQKTFEKISSTMLQKSSNFKLLFIAFSAGLISYTAGFKKLKYKKFRLYLFIGSLYQSVLLISRDTMIGVNNNFAIFMQLFPIIISSLIVGYIIKSSKSYS
jgi:uncharacterized membrane protein YdjX (TVP38/TMEM64 family)